MKQIILRNSEPLRSVKTFPFVLTKRYSSILLTTANHLSQFWATSTQFTSSQQKHSSGNKCNWRQKQFNDSS